MNGGKDWICLSGMLDPVPGWRNAGSGVSGDYGVSGHYGDSGQRARYPVACISSRPYALIKAHTGSKPC